MRYCAKVVMAAGALTAVLGTAASAQTQVLEDTSVDATLSIGSGEDVVVRGTVTVNGPPASGDLDPAVTIGGDGSLTLEGLLDASGLSTFGEALIQVGDDGRLNVPGGLGASLTGFGTRDAILASGSSEVRLGPDEVQALSVTRPLVTLLDSAVLFLDQSRLRSGLDDVLVAAGSSRIEADGVDIISGTNSAAVRFISASTGIFRDSQIQSATLSGTSVAEFIDTTIQVGDATAQLSVQDDATARFQRSLIELSARGAQAFGNGSIELTDSNVTNNGDSRFAIRDDGRLQVVNSSIQGGLTSSGSGFSAFELSDRATASVDGGRFQAGGDGLRGDSPVFVLSDDAELTVSGGVFVEQDNSSPGSTPAGPLAGLGGRASLTLIGDLSTFFLDGAMLDPADVNGVVTVSALTGTLDGVLSNGDLLTDFRFERSAASTLRLVDSGGGTTVVPSPTAAAAGLVLLVGLTRRRRR